MGAQARAGQAGDRREEAGGAIEGTVAKVVFANPETRYAVLRVRVKGGATATVVGPLADVGPGQELHAEGCWRDHPRFGEQFEAQRWEVAPPTSRKGLIRYLGSGIVKGIGPKLAERIVGHFGKGVLDVLDHTPERIGEVAGIGPRKAREFQGAWEQQQSLRELTLFLHSCGIGPALAKRIERRFGKDSLDVARNAPYRLAIEVRGIGFLTADRIAREAGIPREGEERLAAGLLYVLEQAEGEGHVFLPREELLERAARLLEVPEAACAAALHALRRQELAGCQRIPCPPFDRGTDHEIEGVYLPELLAIERDLAARLGALAAARRRFPPIDAARAIPWVERKLRVKLSEGQRTALATALRECGVVITGGPGVGKTTLLRCLTRILLVKKLRFSLAAPTGRAAKRLAEVTGFEASTIHRLLRFQPELGTFEHGPSRPLKCDALIVDEASMIDLRLAEAIARALAPGTLLVLVGDADQLPPVGAGQVLGDLIEAETLPVARLDEIYRQARTSLIVRNAHLVNRGEMPEIDPPGDGGDFYFHEEPDPEKALRMILRLVGERIPARFGLRAAEDIQVLCPMYRGAIGADRLNRELQQLLNPKGEGIPRAGFPFRAGDRVIQLRNDYDREVFNGDVGHIESYDAEDATCRVRFEGRRVTYDRDAMDDLAPAYAISVHRSQGAEYPAVVLPLFTQHFLLLHRNLLYTAITRARKLCVIVGTRKALELAVRNQSPRRRHSGLSARLRWG